MDVLSCIFYGHVCIGIPQQDAATLAAMKNLRREERESREDGEMRKIWKDLRKKRAEIITGPPERVKTSKATAEVRI